MERRRRWKKKDYRSTAGSKNFIQSDDFVRLARPSVIWQDIGVTTPILHLFQPRRKLRSSCESNDGKSSRNHVTPLIRVARIVRRTGRIRSWLICFQLNAVITTYEFIFYQRGKKKRIIKRQFTVEKPHLNYRNAPPACIAALSLEILSKLLNYIDNSRIKQ